MFSKKPIWPQGCVFVFLLPCWNPKEIPGGTLLNQQAARGVLSHISC